jgi:hypothetical protein
MNTITLNDFRHLKQGELTAMMPLAILIEGEEKYVIGTKTQVVVIGDLHPHMKTRINCLINRARMGMPKAVKITSTVSPTPNINESVTIA